MLHMDKEYSSPNDIMNYDIVDKEYNSPNDIMNQDVLVLLMNWWKEITDI